METRDACIPFLPHLDAYVLGHSEDWTPLVRSRLIIRPAGSSFLSHSSRALESKQLSLAALHLARLKGLCSH